MHELYTRRLIIGAGLVVLSFFCLAATNAIVKLIGPNIKTAQILFTQYAIAFCLILPFCYSLKLKSSHLFLLFMRSMGGLFAFYFVFISLAYVSVADATLLLNTGPFFLPLIAFLFFKEPISHKLLWGIIPGFIGIALILQPETDIFQWESLLPLLSGLAVAVVFIVLKELHKHREPLQRILFYLFLFATCVTAPFGLAVWQAPTFYEWILLILAGITSFLSQTLITVGLKYGSPKALVPLCYTSVVFALFFDWCLWATLPTLIAFIGIILVVLSGIVTLVLENQTLRQVLK